MSYTVVALVWRKAGTTPAAFKSHYERHHIPLLLSLLGDAFPITHTRYYFTRTASDAASDNSNQHYPATVLLGTADDFDYDACCELVFEDREKFHAFLARLGEPGVAAEVGKDQEMFMEAGKGKLVQVDEPCVTKRPGQT